MMNDLWLQCASIAGAVLSSFILLFVMIDILIRISSRW